MWRNIGSNWLLLLVSIITTYFLVPFNLKVLGQDSYGVWLIITALTGYLSLLQLGVPMASVRHITSAIARNDREDLNRVVVSCAALYVVLGLVVAAAGIAIQSVFETIYHLPPATALEAQGAFRLTIIGLALGFLSQMPYAILSSYHEFVLKNAFMIGAVLLRTVLIVVLLIWSPTLIAMAAAQLSITVLELVVLWPFVLLRHPEIRPSFANFSYATVKGITGFSIFVFLLSMGFQLSFQTDALVIGHYLGPGAVPEFSIPNNLLLYLMQLVVGIASVVMPLATSLKEQGRDLELRTVFLKWSKLSLAMVWCAAAFFFVFGPDFLGFWVGPVFSEMGGLVLRILTFSYLFFLPLRGVAMPILMGIGKPAAATIAVLVAGVANLVLSVALVGPFGLAGVAWGTTIPNLALSVVFTILICRELGIPPLAYVSELLARPLPAFVLVLVPLIALRSVWQPVGLFEIGAAGALTVVAFASVWLAFVLQRDQHVSLPPALQLNPARFPWLSQASRLS